MTDTLAALSTTQINNLNTTTLSGLDDDLLTGGSPRPRFARLTATTIDNIGALTSTQIGGLSATQSASSTPPKSMP